MRLKEKWYDMPLSMEMLGMKTMLSGMKSIRYQPEASGNRLVYFTLVRVEAIMGFTVSRQSA